MGLDLDTAANCDRTVDSPLASQTIVQGLPDLPLVRRRRSPHENTRVETLLLFKRLTGSLHSRLRGDAGQTMAEYAILLAVIALVVIAVAVFLGSSISSIFSSTSHKL